MNLVTQPARHRTCGQCCVAMILGITREEAIELVGKSGRTRTADLLRALQRKRTTLDDRRRITAARPLPIRTCLVRSRLNLLDPVRGTVRPRGHWMVWTGTEMLCPDRGRLGTILPAVWKEWTDPGSFERLTNYWPVRRMTQTEILQLTLTGCISPKE